jgi:hypothetical protein
MATIILSKTDTLKHLTDKVNDGKVILIKCQNINNQTDYDNLVDEHENWWQSSVNLLRQLFSNEKISEDFLNVGFTTFDKNASFATSVRRFSQNISSDINKLEIIIKDVSNDLYKPQIISAMANPNISAAKIELWKALIIALITAATAIFTTYIAIPDKPATAVDKQGLGNLSIQGKWLYACTDYNGKYQHGGRFKVSKQTNGSLQLNGERMWKDIQVEQSSKWVCNDFKGDKILPWKSHWIYVHDDNQFNMEYEITVDGHVIKGYCNGDITSENNDVQKIEGYFYQLLPQTPLLAG